MLQRWTSSWRFGVSAPRSLLAKTLLNVGSGDGCRRSAFTSLAIAGRDFLPLNSSLARSRSFSNNASRESPPESPSQRDTIYAPATPPGRGGIGVIRISGAHARNVWTSMLVSHSQVTPNAEGRPLRTPGPEMSRMFFRCLVVHPETREVLDDGMAVFFHGSSASLA